MNKLQERTIENLLELCLENFRRGWGKHELHDNLVSVLETLDTICGEKHPKHPKF
jgi:hypothetical protein